MISAALMCLAMNVYHESRSEPMLGQYAVAHVVVNRVQSDKYPDEVCVKPYWSALLKNTVAYGSHKFYE